MILKVEKGIWSPIVPLVVTLRIEGYGALLVQLIVKSLINVAKGSGLPEN